MVGVGGDGDQGVVGSGDRGDGLGSSGVRGGGVVGWWGPESGGVRGKGP